MSPKSRHRLSKEKRERDTAFNWVLTLRGTIKCKNSLTVQNKNTLCLAHNNLSDHYHPTHHCFLFLRFEPPWSPRSRTSSISLSAAVSASWRASAMRSASRSACSCPTSPSSSEMRSNFFCRYLRAATLLRWRLNSSSALALSACLTAVAEEEEEEEEEEEDKGGRGRPRLLPARVRPGSSTGLVAVVVTAVASKDDDDGDDEDDADEDMDDTAGLVEPVVPPHASAGMAVEDDRSRNETSEKLPLLLLSFSFGVASGECLGDSDSGGVRFCVPAAAAEAEADIATAEGEDAAEREVGAEKDVDVDVGAAVARSSASCGAVVRNEAQSQDVVSSPALSWPNRSCDDISSCPGNARLWSEGSRGVDDERIDAGVVSGADENGVEAEVVVESADGPSSGHGDAEEREEKSGARSALFKMVETEAAETEGAKTNAGEESKQKAPEFSSSGPQERNRSPTALVLQLPLPW